MCVVVPTEAVRAVLRHPSLLSEGDWGGELRKAALRSLLPRSFLWTGEQHFIPPDSTHLHGHIYTHTLLLPQQNNSNTTDWFDGLNLVPSVSIYFIIYLTNKCIGPVWRAKDLCKINQPKISCIENVSLNYLCEETLCSLGFFLKNLDPWHTFIFVNEGIAFPCRQWSSEMKKDKKADKENIKYSLSLLENGGETYCASCQWGTEMERQQDQIFFCWVSFLNFSVWSFLPLFFYVLYSISRSR